MFGHIHYVNGLGYQLAGTYEADKLNPAPSGYYVPILQSDLVTEYEQDPHTDEEYAVGQKLRDDFDYAAAIQDGLIDTLWRNTKAFLVSHFDDAASGFVTDQKNKGAPKATAVYGWYFTHWENYYVKKAMIQGGNLDVDLKPVGEPPYSMQDIMLEASEEEIVVIEE